MCKKNEEVKERSAEGSLKIWGEWQPSLAVFRINRGF